MDAQPQWLSFSACKLLAQTQARYPIDLEIALCSSCGHFLPWSTSCLCYWWPHLWLAFSSAASLPCFFHMPHQSSRHQRRHPAHQKFGSPERGNSTIYMGIAHLYVWMANSGEEFWLTKYAAIAWNILERLMTRKQSERRSTQRNLRMPTGLSGALGIIASNFLHILAGTHLQQKKAIWDLKWSSLLGKPLIVCAKLNTCFYLE